MIEKILSYFNKEVLIALSSFLFALVYMFAYRFYKEQKNNDENNLKAINGLGQRVNREIEKLEIMQKVWHKDHKDTLQRIESKIDHLVLYVHEIENKVMQTKHEIELKDKKKEA